MAELRACFREMGFEDVTTVLQTGNVLLKSDRALPELKRTIETGLLERFNYPAHVHIVEMSRLRQIVEASPFDGGDSQMHSYVVFFESGRERELAVEAQGINGESESVELGDGVLYWQVPKGSTLRSSFSKFLTKARYRDFHTNRNINTLHKIVGQ